MRGAGFDQFAVHVPEIHAHDVVLGHAVLQAAQASGVFGHVAAQGGNGLGARVRGIEQAAFGDLCCELGGDHAGFDHGVHVFLVDFDDTVQAVGQDHHAAGMGNGAAGEVGTRSAHSQGQAVLVAQPGDLAQGFAGFGPDDQGGHDGVEDGCIVGIRVAVGFAGHDVLGSGDGFKILDELFGTHVCIS